LVLLKIVNLAFLLLAVMLNVTQVIMRFCFEINTLFVCLPGISHGMQLVSYRDVVLTLPCATAELNVNARWVWTDNELVWFEFSVFKAYTVVLCVKSPVFVLVFLWNPERDNSLSLLTHWRSHAQVLSCLLLSSLVMWTVWLSSALTGSKMGFVYVCVCLSCVN